MVTQSNITPNISRRGRMKREHETVIASVRPQLEGRTQKILNSLLRDIVPVIEETIIARITPTSPVTRVDSTQVSPIVKKRWNRGDIGMKTRLAQAEKVLHYLLKHKGYAKVRTLVKDLHNEIETYRLSAYLWDLKQMGAEIEREKRGRNIIGLEVTNKQQMQAYLQKRLKQIGRENHTKVA